MNFLLPFPFLLICVFPSVLIAPATLGTILKPDVGARLTAEAENLDVNIVGDDLAPSDTQEGQGDTWRIVYAVVGLAHRHDVPIITPLPDSEPEAPLIVNIVEHDQVVGGRTKMPTKVVIICVEVGHCQCRNAWVTVQMTFLWSTKLLEALLTPGFERRIHHLRKYKG